MISLQRANGYEFIIYNDFLVPPSLLPPPPFYLFRPFTLSLFFCSFSLIFYGCYVCVLGLHLMQQKTH